MTQPILIDAPGIAKLVTQLAALLRQDYALRQAQGQNAQLAKYFDQPGVFSAIGSVPVTGNVIYGIAQAKTDNEKFFSLVLTFDAANGSGRYCIDGRAPTPLIGTFIPAGAGVLTVIGADNIKNFQMMAEGGQTLSFSRYLFV